MPNPFDELLMGLPKSDMGGQVALPPSAPQAPKTNWGAIIADALLGFAGQPGQYPQRVARERAQEQEQAQWHQRRQADLEDYGRKLEMQNDPRYAKPDVSPMERDAAAWQRMAPDQRAAYGEFKSMGAPDPDVFTTLPNGQFYAGPRSGLASALGGGQSAPRPVGKLTPISGGPTPQASGSFLP